jgi:hypothetical protein
MPILSVAAMNTSLDDDYGTTRGPNAPDAHEVALFTGDPTLGGVELAGGGYARVVVNPGDWAAAVGGAKATVAPVQFPDATADWASQARYWVLFDHADHVTGWDYAALNEALSVFEGPGPAVQLTVYYADTVTPIE